MRGKKVCACTIWFANQKKGVESGLAMEMVKNCVDLSGSMRRFSFKHSFIFQESELRLASIDVWSFVHNGKKVSTCHSFWYNFPFGKSFWHYKVDLPWRWWKIVSICREVWEDFCSNIRSSFKSLNWDWLPKKCGALVTIGRKFQLMNYFDMIFFFVTVGVSDVVVKRCQILREMNTSGWTALYLVLTRYHTGHSHLRVGKN